MSKEKILIIGITILIILGIFLFKKSPLKFGATFTEVPQFYEDKTVTFCYLVHIDGTKDLMKPGDYPPNLKHNGDWAYCQHPQKQTILLDGQFYKTYNFSSSTQEVFAKPNINPPSTTTLTALGISQ